MSGNSDSAQRRALLLTIAGTASLVGACASRQTVFQVSLKISAAGEYQVNGQPVSRASLQETLASLKPRDGEFSIYVQPVASAPYEAVQYAMFAAQAVGAKIGLVGNEKF
jgi:biopolymer transport protein ExbD